MANYTGKDGIVKVGSGAGAAIAEVREWELESTSEITENTTMNSAQSNGGWKTNMPTMKAWSGTLTCFWDDTDTTGQDTIQEGAEPLLKLYPTGTDDDATFYTGNAIITTVTRKSSVDGMIEATFAFTGTGALTKDTVSS